MWVLGKVSCCLVMCMLRGSALADGPPQGDLAPLNVVQNAVSNSSNRELLQAMATYGSSVESAAALPYSDMQRLAGLLVGSQEGERLGELVLAARLGDPDHVRGMPTNQLLSVAEFVKATSGPNIAADAVSRWIDCGNLQQVKDPLEMRSLAALLAGGSEQTAGARYVFGSHLTQHVRCDAERTYSLEVEYWDGLITDLHAELFPLEDRLHWWQQIDQAFALHVEDSPTPKTHEIRLFTWIGRRLGRKPMGPRLGSAVHDV